MRIFNLNNRTCSRDLSRGLGRGRRNVGRSGVWGRSWTVAGVWGRGRLRANVRRGWARCRRNFGRRNRTFYKSEVPSHGIAAFVRDLEKLDPGAFFVGSSINNGTQTREFPALHVILSVQTVDVWLLVDRDGLPCQLIASNC